MKMEEIVRFLKEAQTYYLATVEGDQQKDTIRISIMFGVQQNLIHQNNHRPQIQQQSVKDI